MRLKKVTFEEREARAANRDPLTGEPGAHPVGVGLGATTGATTGALIGAFAAGPVGAALGGALGAFAGGLAGKEAGEAFEPTQLDTFWRENYYKRPYHIDGVRYKHYAPAYRYGAWAAQFYENEMWCDVFSRLEAGWPGACEGSCLTWTQAAPAVMDAWTAVREHLPPKPAEPNSDVL